MKTKSKSKKQNSWKKGDKFSYSGFTYKVEQVRKLGVETFISYYCNIMNEPYWVKTAYIQKENVCQNQITCY